MELFGYDYLMDKPNPDRGLLKLASTIMAHRIGKNSLLFDNGDFLQGTPLADEIAPSSQHLLAEAFNELGYDAITLGNHDFDYGLDVLEGFLHQLDAPVVGSNISGTPDSVKSHLVMNRTFRCEDGSRAEIRIGVIGLLPPQTTVWNAHCLKKRVVIEDIVEAAKRAAENAREDGADIVIALAHAGLDQSAPHHLMENALVPLSHLKCLDAIFGGHTHEWFETHSNHVSSRLGSVPVVQSGSNACGFGVIDPTLSEHPTWSVVSFETQLERPKSDTPNPKLFGYILDAHQRVREKLAKPVGASSRPLSNHFSMIGFDDGIKLVHEALLEHATHITDELGLPTTACYTSFSSDGAFGSKKFLNTEGRIIRERDLSSIVPFNNPICVIGTTTERLRKWISESSIFLNEIAPRQNSQALLSGKSPSYFFDQFSSISYQIDLSQSVNDHRRRIPRLAWNGEELENGQSLAVIASTYRAYGGGGFVYTNPDQTIWESTQGARDIVAKYLENIGTFNPCDAPLWTFAPVPETQLTFELPRSYRVKPAINGLSQVSDDDTTIRYQLDLRELAPTGQ